MTSLNPNLSRSEGIAAGTAFVQQVCDTHHVHDRNADGPVAGPTSLQAACFTSFRREGSQRAVNAALSQWNTAAGIWQYVNVEFYKKCSSGRAPRTRSRSLVKYAG